MASISCWGMHFMFERFMFQSICVCVLLLQGNVYRLFIYIYTYIQSQYINTNSIYIYQQYPIQTQQKMHQNKQKYKIPKNLCQVCYQHSGRYILDCYCIICQECYPSYSKRLISSTCPLCLRQSKGNKIDAKQQSSVKRIGHLFENVDAGLQRVLEVYKFQNEIATRYCHFLEKQLGGYRDAVNQLLSVNPTLHGFFSARVKLRRNAQTQQNQRAYSANHSIRAQNTIKPNRQYASQIFQSKRSTIDLNGMQQNHNNNHNNNIHNYNNTHNQYNEYTNSRQAEITGVRAIGRSGNNHNHSGNVVYKVPNINYNTAVRSSKRIINHNQKIAPDFDDDPYHRYRKF